jgi:hypothetical protein
VSQKVFDVAALPFERRLLFGRIRQRLSVEHEKIGKRPNLRGSGSPPALSVGNNKGTGIRIGWNLDAAALEQTDHLVDLAEDRVRLATIAGL